MIEIPMKQLLIVMLLFLAGCSPSASLDAVPDAKKLANTIIDNFSPEKFESTFPHYNALFWKSMPKQTWKKIVPNLYKKLGAIKSCKLNNWKQTTKAGAKDSGNYVVLSYQCQHVKYESTLVFTIFKPLKDGESTIVGQTINSLGLLLE
jgi:hypothetical protein